MPLFDYICQQCSHEFEALQGINEDALQECPECKEPRLKKKIAAPAFTFKGSGWYKDLYGSPSSKEGAKSTSSEPEKAKSTEKKSDSPSTSKSSSGSGGSKD